MTQTSERGSSKLWQTVFDREAPTQDDLARALEGAREDYTIKRWWKYGQPAIDLIRATLEIPVADSGRVIQDIIGVHGNEIQVNMDVFPYGIPYPDGVRLDVTFERNVG